MKYNFSYGLLFLRLLLGIIIFWQGYGKIFRWGMDNVYAQNFLSFEASFLPKWILQFTLYFTSYGEFIGGILLVLGLFRKWTYLALALILLIVSFGHGLQDAIWDLSHVLYRSLLLFPLILIPRELDVYSIDEKWMKV